MIGYAQFGQGQEKVMVTHGWKTDQSCFDPIISSLDQERFSFVFIDQRGYGSSKNLDGPYTIKQVADDMIALAGHLDWENYHIIGHSMGGKVIQQVMADSPGNIKSAMGITPVPASALPFDEQGWNLFAGASEDFEKRLQVFRISTGNRYTDTWYRMITHKSFEMSKSAAFKAYLESWVNFDLVQSINGCKIPIKVIVGENDPDLKTDLMKLTFGKWFPNLEIVSLPNCGHYPMLETPLSLAAELESFLTCHC